jgi:type IV pilus assembly protein PilV
VRWRSVGGFTFIEVLVAVFVLAVGIVGAVATQMVALRTRQQSGLMSDGVQLASALADRMRANAGQMRVPDGANPYLQLRYDASADGAPPPAPVLCHGGSACSPAELAQFDLYEITHALHSRFPGGRIAVCRDAAVWNTERGAFGWPCTYTSNAPVVIKLGWRGKEHDGGDALDPALEVAPGIALVVAGVPG